MVWRRREPRRSELTGVLRLVLGAPRRAAVALLTVAAAAATLLVRRRRPSLALPEPGPLAADAAVSVHNAVKGTVMSMARVSDPPGDGVGEIVRAAMLDAARTGVDLVAAAIGAVEGVHEIAHLVDGSRDDVVASAASIAVEVATERGPSAGDRVRDVLGPLLPA